MTSSVESALSGLGLTLPEAIAPVANYVPYVRTGNLLFVSGQISKTAAGAAVTGKLGADVDVAAGQKAAELCALNILAQVKAAVGDLDSIVRVVRLNAFVNSAPEFTDQPQVVNGASNLFANVLGDKGRHSRTAVGVAALPLGVAVEIDAIIEVS
ncbi:RidA family protein [Pleomorphomonas koreensis]|uniref:RidA family protein n=1 Tax=Pleomorphomonas koreensis TaxID=257440 RepID=UPI000425BF95|nr:RidA family protein [Pleomorphomonas koreensis]